MSPFESARCQLPDVAAEAAPEPAALLAWVGMEEIEAPVWIPGPEGPTRSPARVAAAVNLADPSARGIHMSRLYLLVDEMLGREPLTPALVRRLLRAFVESHRGLSDRARVRVRFEQLLRRPALASAHSGWRAYPVTVAGLLEHGQLQLELGVTVTYSSTCPCSAALARQLIQRRFAEDFPAELPVARERVLAWLGSEQGVAATPHSQRSHAEIRVRLLPGFGDFPVRELIDLAEEALATPVQAAVKREDEQAFAALNAAHTMFCEDAARRLKRALERDERFLDFWVRASHLESLHPHDAVAIAVKGVPGGYRAGLHD